MFTAISGENLKKLLDGGTVKAKSRLSLRPEGTAGVVRAVVQHDLVPQGAAPSSSCTPAPCSEPNVHRKAASVSSTRWASSVWGAEEPTVDAEAIIMLMQFYEAVGIPHASMRLLVNSMGCDRCRPAYREKVLAYLHEHAEALCDTCLTRAETNPLRAFDCKNPDCAQVMEGAPKITDCLCDECRAHYQAVKELLEAAGVTYVEDPTLVRGLDYYTRTVFEVQVVDGLGSQNAIGRRRALRQACRRGGRPADAGFGLRAWLRALRAGAAGGRRGISPGNAFAKYSSPAWTTRCAPRRSRWCRRVVTLVCLPTWTTSAAA